MTKDNHTLDALKFTKKPVTIEAWQFTTDVAWNYFTNRKLPPFGCDSISGEYHTENKKIYDAYFYIKTLEGNMRVSLNDWIIKGVKGEFYPCKPDIFEATYTRPQPSGDAVKAIMTHNDGEWKLTDGISTGYGNTPEAASDAFNEDKAFNVNKYRALTQPKADVDLYSLKREVKKYLDSKVDGYWWDDVITYLHDKGYLAAQGHIGVPEGDK